MRIERGGNLPLCGVAHRLPPQLRGAPAARIGPTRHETHAVHLVRHIGHVTAVESRRFGGARDRIERGLGHRLHAAERIYAIGRRGIATGCLREHRERSVERHRAVRIRTDLDRFAAWLIEANRPRAALPARALRCEKQILAVGRPTRVAAFGVRRRPPLRLSTGGVDDPDLVVTLVLGLDGLGDRDRHPLAVGRHGRTAHVHDAIPVGQHHGTRAFRKLGDRWYYRRLLGRDRTRGRHKESGHCRRAAQQMTMGGQSGHSGARGGKLGNAKRNLPRENYQTVIDGAFLACPIAILAIA